MNIPLSNYRYSNFILQLQANYCNDCISALIVFARFWRILRVINGVIVGTKQDGDARVKHLKKKIAIMKNQEFENGSLKVSLDEITEENVRLNLLQERLEEDDGR